jgi:hypothetical protein
MIVSTGKVGFRVPHISQGFIHRTTAYREVYWTSDFCRHTKFQLLWESSVSSSISSNPCTTSSFLRWYVFRNKFSYIWFHKWQAHLLDNLSLNSTEWEEVSFLTVWQMSYCQDLNLTWIMDSLVVVCCKLGFGYLCLEIFGSLYLGQDLWKGTVCHNKDILPNSNLRVCLWPWIWKCPQLNSGILCKWMYVPIPFSSSSYASSSSGKCGHGFMWQFYQYFQHSECSPNGAGLN